MVQILHDKSTITNAQVLESALDGRSTKIPQLLLDRGGNLGNSGVWDAQGSSLCHWVSAPNVITQLEMPLMFGSDITSG